MDFTSATRCVEQSIKALNNSVFARKGLPAVGKAQRPARRGGRKEIVVRLSALVSCI